jgi:hypothetical protein
MNIEGTSQTAIKAKRSLLVKWGSLVTFSLLLGGLSSGISLGRRAIADDTETLPSITAKNYTAQIDKRSTSGRVYLLSIPSPAGQELPDVGHLVLLRTDGAPIMAFRVLKQYNAKNQFAAKWLRRYGDTKQLEPSSQYEALEKVSDKDTPPLTSDDKKDLRELEAPPPPPGGETPNAAISAEASPTAGQASGEPSTDTAASAAVAPETPNPVPSAGADNGELPPPAAATSGGDDGLPKPVPATKAYDPDLDSGTSPPPKGAVETSETPGGGGLLDKGDDISSVMVEEMTQIDKQNNAIALGAGAYRNSSTAYNAAANIRYSRTLKHLIHYKSKNLQDNLALDGSLGFFKYLGTSGQGDTYTVVPVTITLRYTILPNEDFGAFVFAGFEQSVVAQSVNAVSTTESTFQSFFPEIGIGALFRIGPSWYMRADLGYDYIGVSIALRF